MAAKGFTSQFCRGAASTINLYVLKVVLRPTLIAGGLGLMILLMARFVRMSELVLGKNSSLTRVSELMAVLIPHYLNAIIPIALFLGLLIGFGKLSRSNEVTAIMNAGVGLLRLAQPILVLSLALALVAICLTGWVSPYARYATRAIAHELRNVAVIYVVEAGVFTKLGNTTIFIDKVDPEQSTYQKLFLFTVDEQGARETVTAKSGFLVEDSRSRRPILSLQDGRWQKLSADPNSLSEQQENRIFDGTFTTRQTPFGEAHSREYRQRGHDAHELTLVELFSAARAPPKHMSESGIQAGLHKRLVKIATILILPFLALPFAMGTGAGGQNHRFVLAIVILVAYLQVLEQGTLAVEHAGFSPIVALWGPFVLVCIFALWRFWFLCFRVGPDPVSIGLDRIAMSLSGWLARIAAASPLKNWLDGRTEKSHPLKRKIGRI